MFPAFTTKIMIFLGGETVINPLSTDTEKLKTKSFYLKQKSTDFC